MLRAFTASYASGSVMVCPYTAMSAVPSWMIRPWLS